MTQQNATCFRASTTWASPGTGPICGVSGSANNRPELSGSGHVSIAPTGEPASTEADGDINLFSQASKIFGQLNANNVFTAPLNTFQDLIVRRIQVTSDASQKTDIQVFSDTEGMRLSQQVAAYRCCIDGRPAAGFLAHEVPVEFTRRTDAGTLVVDYNALVAALWASVRCAHERLDSLEASKGKLGLFKPRLHGVTTKQAQLAPEIGATPREAQKKEVILNDPMLYRAPQGTG